MVRGFEFARMHGFAPNAIVVRYSLEIFLIKTDACDEMLVLKPTFLFTPDHRQYSPSSL